ncbi:hypothetical protein ACIBQX_18990 [Nonomuraea sp. NPDC049714]|uniref:hypothetical protein n=1 Tax=Nonomuraea sp. NPDC049714 TaxID=3364357 RepID=UPI0037B35F8F
MSTANILRRAADLIERGESGTPASALMSAVYDVTDRWDHQLFDKARLALATHLNYATDRDPSRDLRRWSQLRTPAQMATQMRAAADASERGAP